ncbi:MAG: hypothetical protein JWO13_1808 [Acidobacteriales bacterium]|nr:hypothetical protein [Terriglobales bacterium]
MNLASLGRLIELRAIDRRGVYLLCAAVTTLFGVFSVGMTGGYEAIGLYMVLDAICIWQFIRPTLLGWSLLMLAFSTYALLVVAHYEPPLNEFLLFLACGVVPALVLIWARPRQQRATENSSTK